jgi:DNA-binding NarL/FixJ family response regulator
MSPLRIVIADDHPLYRSGLRTLLASQPDLDLIGEAATGEEAIELAATSAPGVVLMDITMPGIGGIEAVRQLTTANPQVAVLMLTMLEDGPSALAALQAGARGYLVKAPPAARYYGQSVPWPAAKSSSAPRSPPKY